MRKVVSIGVFRGGKVLMGIRRDNGKYTFPGGHVDSGEELLDAAVRELAEETGLCTDKRNLQPFGHWKTTDYQGKPLEIFPFRLNWDYDGEEPQIGLDPDGEIEQWFWIPSQPTLPDAVMANLHSPKNALLMALGLQKPDEGVERYLVSGVMRSAQQLV